MIQIELQPTEAVTKLYSVNKVFLKVLKNSQEKACVRVSFLIKLQGLKVQLYLKIHFGTGVFVWILRNL